MTPLILLMLCLTVCSFARIEDFIGGFFFPRAFPQRPTTPVVSYLRTRKEEHRALCLGKRRRKEARASVLPKDVKPETWAKKDDMW